MFSYVSCAALIGCASSNTTPATSTTPLETVRVAGRVGGGLMTVETHPDAAAHAAIVAAPIDRVWAIVRAAYDTLAIPVAVFDPASHTLGNAAMRIKRRLGDVAISKYVNCGNTQGSSTTDTYEIQMSVVTTLQPAPSGGTTITTAVEAQGRPITLSAEFARCRSTGGLEARLVEVVKAQVGG